MSNSAAATILELGHESHIILPGFGACDVLTRDASMQLLRRRSGERELLLTPMAGTASSEAVLRINTQFELTNTDPPPGVIKSRGIETGASGPVLVLEPAAGTPLSSQVSVVRLEDGLRIAREIARIISELHKRGITHREVRPAAFLVADDGAVTLVDLGAASRSAQSATSVLPTWDRLPWVSPEQTSRMNRGFDRRADLYSIGALAHYLFSGRTPFEANSALAMIHSHIAVKPEPLSKFRPELAGPLEAIVLKLLAKRPEDRYQTARGLLIDLDRLHAGLSRSGRTPSLQPGGDDRPDWLQPPQGLYGRETELAALKQALNGARAGQRRTVALFGSAGLGKSSLARELQEPVLAAGGAFVSGVFERVGSAVHGALLAALDEVVHHQLALDAAGLSTLRARLARELASDLPVLVDLVPSLQMLVGAQPPAAHVPQTEARNRLHHALRRFVAAFCSPGSPLVLFLDDVQWADENSLALLEALGRVPGLLLLLAARPEAAADGHPFAASLDRMADAGLGVQRLNLRPFDAPTCNRLVADLLHSGPEETAALADLLAERSSGNPMHFVQAISALHEAGVIMFDHAKGHWAWSMQEVRRFGVDDNVARLLSTRIERLPAATRDVLRTLSVMSRRVALSSLVLASGQSAADLVHLMGHAEAEDLVLRDARNAAWGFIHDRVRDAVLDTISERERAKLHWLIAQRLIRGFGPNGSEDVHFNVATHCVQARELVVTSPWEQRLSVAQLLAAAARRASDTLAFDTAREFLQLASDCLGDDGWAREPALAFQTLHELGEARAFSRQREAAEQAFQQCLRRGNNPLELAKVHCTRTALRILIGDLAGALDTAREGLALVGVRLPRKPSKLTVALALLRSRMLLRGRKPHQLADMPRMEAGAPMVALKILSQILPAAYSHSEEMAGLAFLLMTNQALQHGNSGAAGHAYAIYGHIVSKVLGDPKTGYEFGKFGLELAHGKLGDPLSAVATGMAFATLLNHWQVDWRRSKDEFLRVVDEATSSGDLLNASHASSGLTMLYHVLAEPIGELPALTLEREAISRRSNYDDGTLYFGGARRWARHLMGLSKSRQSWDGEEGAEADFMTLLEASTFGPVRLGVMTFRLSSHIIAGEVEAAVTLALNHESSLHALSGQTFEVEFNFLAGLAAADAMRAGRTDRATRRLLNESLKRLRKWAELVPVNVAGRRHLLEAQAAVVSKDSTAARREFQAARQEARRRGDWHLIGFAAERQAQLDLEEGLHDQARGLMQVARDAYERWGAVAKLNWLQEDYPELQLAPVSPRQTRDDAVPLDMESALKAATALTSEIRLDRLLEKVVAVAIENAAASRGHLVLDEGGTLTLVSSAQASDVAGISTATSGELRGKGVPLDEANVLARAIVRYVARTSEGIVLHDASTDGRFANDPYLQQHPGISVLCQPLVSQGKRLGILYLENDLAEGAFPPDRLRVMSLLSAQTAISLENARLYSEMQNLTDAQSRFVPYQFLENLHRPDIAQVKLGDHVTKDMSVLFADLRGFTQISEHLEPTEVVEMLNAFFAQMEGPIVKAGGFIDAFTGDEIMALFDTAADQALHAGIGMARALEALNERRSDSLVLKMGMGINTGRLLLGTVGGRDRFKCGVVGNTVNLASRVEQLTKVYGAALLLGEESVRKLESPGDFALREVDRIVVKGNNQPTTIYEVLDAESEPRRELKASIVAQLSDARERYLARNFKGALELYTDARVRAPIDRVPALFEERCRRYLATPPPAEWDGVEPVTT